MSVHSSTSNVRKEEKEDSATSSFLEIEHVDGKKDEEASGFDPRKGLRVRKNRQDIVTLMKIRLVKDISNHHYIYENDDY